MTSYKVHPLADRFPMLPDDELAALAESIERNGLINPIVLDAENQLIDGRNRLKACEMAGVEPTFISLNGHDPVEYILATNVARRHLNAGQRAMATAVAYPEPEKGGRGKNSVLSTEFSLSYLAHARTVVRWASDQVDSVLAGRTELNAAYKVAIERREENESEAGRMEALDQHAPDLAVMVREERLTLAGAIAELKERTRQAEQLEQTRREQRERMTTGFAQAINAIAVSVTVDDPYSLLDAWVAEKNPFPSDKGFAHMWTPDGLRGVAARLERLADAVAEREVAL